MILALGPLARVRAGGQATAVAMQSIIGPVKLTVESSSEWRSAKGSQCMGSRCSTMHLDPPWLVFQIFSSGGAPR